MTYLNGTKIEIVNGLHSGERGVVTGYTVAGGKTFVEVLSDGISEAWELSNTRAVA